MKLFNEFSRAKRLCLEGFWVVAGLAVSSLGNITSVRVFTGLVSPDVYGEVALGLTIMMLFQFSYAGTSAACTRYFTSSIEKGQFYTYIKAVWRVQHRRGWIFFPLVFGIVVFLIVTNRSHLVSLVLAAAVGAIVSNYGGVLDSLQYAARQRNIIAMHQAAGSWLRIFFVVLAVYFFGKSSQDVMWGLALAPLPVIGSQYFFYLKAKRKYTQETEVAPTRDQIVQYCMPMRNFALPYLLWSLPIWLQLSGDRWLLQLYTNSWEVGIYSSLYQIAFFPITATTRILNSLFTPIIYARAGDYSNTLRIQAAHSIINKLLLCSIGWALIATALVWVYQSPISNILLAENYRGASALLPIMVASAGCFVIDEFSQYYLLTASNSKALIIPKIGAAFNAILILFIGARYWGMTGIVWASLMAGIISIIWKLAATFQQLKRNKNYVSQ
jgi:O-antigen/teichoic acid export membrane protein